MDTTLTNNDKAAITAALNVIDLFHAVDPDMPMGAVRSFLLIAAQQGLSVTELKVKSGNALAAVSRYHHYLGEVDRRKRPGMGLVIARTSVDDIRRKSLRLTPKGRRLVGEINTVFEKITAVTAKASSTYPRQQVIEPRSPAEAPADNKYRVFS